MVKQLSSTIGRSRRGLTFSLVNGLALMIMVGICPPSLGEGNPGESPMGSTVISGVEQEGKTYIVNGTVEALSYLLTQGAYQLKDDTGLVWIVTPGKMPRIGDRLAVRAQLKYRSILIQGQQFGEHYLIELEQLPPEVGDPPRVVEARTEPEALPRDVTPPITEPPPRTLSVDDFLYPHW